MRANGGLERAGLSQEFNESMPIARVVVVEGESRRCDQEKYA